MTDIATKIYNILVNDEEGKLVQEVANVLAQIIAKGLEESEPENSGPVPAEPLTEPLEIGEKYYCAADIDLPDDYDWDNDSVDHFRLQDKNVFPYTKEGKLGAELRAKVPHPGIHWVEDLMKMRMLSDQACNTDDWDPVQVFVFSFLDKYLPPTTNKRS